MLWQNIAQLNPNETNLSLAELANIYSYISIRVHHTFLETFTVNINDMQRRFH